MNGHPSGEQGQNSKPNNRETPVITGVPKTVTPAGEIHSLILRIRPEFSNYRNPNHRKETVMNRLERKFRLLDDLITKHEKELDPKTLQAVKKVWKKYDLLKTGEK